MVKLLFVELRQINSHYHCLRLPDVRRFKGKQMYYEPFLFSSSGSTELVHKTSVYLPYNHLVRLVA